MNRCFKFGFGLFVISFIFIVLTLSCIRKVEYGERIVAGERVKIKDILSGEYIGKDVSLKGKIDLECGSGCWFILNDNTGKIYVDLGPSNFAIPQWAGREVVVKGKVIREEGEIKLIGKGVRLK